MVLNEAVLLTVVIDSWENHEVAIVNVPGAFMQVEQTHACETDRRHGAAVVGNREGLVPKLCGV